MLRPWAWAALIIWGGLTFFVSLFIGHHFGNLWQLAWMVPSFAVGLAIGIYGKA